MQDTRKLFVVICVLSSTWASIVPILKEEGPHNKEALTISRASENVVGANEILLQTNSETSAPTVIKIELVSQNSENDIIDDSSDKLRIGDRNSPRKKPKPEKPGNSNTASTTTGGYHSGKPNKPENNSAQPEKPGNSNTTSTTTSGQTSGKPNKPIHGHGKPTNVTNNSSKPSKSSQTPMPTALTNNQLNKTDTFSVSLTASEKVQEPTDKDSPQVSASNENSPSNPSVVTVTVQQIPVPNVAAELSSSNKANSTDDKNVDVATVINIAAELTGPQLTINRPVNVFGKPPNFDFGFLSLPKVNETDKVEGQESNSNAEKITELASKIEAQIQQIKYQVIQAVNSSASILGTDKTTVDSGMPGNTSDATKQQSVPNEQIQSILSAFANNTETIKLSLQQNLNSSQVEAAAFTITQSETTAKENENKTNEVSAVELGSQEFSIAVPIENLAKPEIYYEVEEMVDEPAITNGNGILSSSAQQSLSGNSQNVQLGNFQSQFHNLLTSIYLLASQQRPPLQSGSQEQLQYTITNNNGNFDSNTQPQQPILGNTINQLVQAAIQSHIQSQFSHPAFINHVSGNGAIPISASSPVGQPTLPHSGAISQGAAISDFAVSSQPAGAANGNHLHPVNSNIAFAAVYPAVPSSVYPNLVLSSQLNAIVPEIIETNPIEPSVPETNPSPIALTTTSEEDTFAEEVQTVSIDTMSSDKSNNGALEKLYRPNYNNAPAVDTDKIYRPQNSQNMNTHTSQSQTIVGAGPNSVISGHPSVIVIRPPHQNGYLQQDSHNNAIGSTLLEKPNKPFVPLNSQLQQQNSHNVGHNTVADKPSRPQNSQFQQQNSQNLGQNTAADKPSKPENFQDKPSKPENSLDKPSKPQNSLDKPSKPQNSQDKPSKPQNSQDKPSKPEDSLDKPSKPQNSQDKPSKPQNSQDKPSKPEDSLDKPSKPENSQDKPSKPENSQLQQNSQNSVLIALVDKPEKPNKPEKPKPNKPEISQVLQNNTQENLSTGSQQTVLQLNAGFGKPNLPQMENIAHENMQTVVFITTRPRPGKPNRPQLEAFNLTDTKPFGIGSPHDKPGKGKHPSNNPVKVEDQANELTAPKNETDIKDLKQESANPQESNSVKQVVEGESTHGNRLVGGYSTNQNNKTENTAEETPSASKPATDAKPSKPLSNKHKKPKPKPNEGKISSNTKPKPQFGFGFGKRKPLNKQGEDTETINGVVTKPQISKPSGWQLPKWASFSTLYQNLFGGRQRNDGDSEENQEEACVPPTVNLRDKQDERSLCGANLAKDGFTCERLCKDSGFNVGTCREDNSCICSYDESPEVGLRMEYYYDRNVTNWEDYYPSYDSCSRCSCSNLCIETGYFLGVCGDACYCARPFHNGVPLELFTSPEQKSQ